MEQPELEKQRGERVEIPTQVEISSGGKFQAKWVEGAHAAIPPGVRWSDMKP